MMTVILCMALLVSGVFCVVLANVLHLQSRSNPIPAAKDPTDLKGRESNTSPRMGLAVQVCVQAIAVLFLVLAGSVLTILVGYRQLQSKTENLEKGSIDEDNVKPKRADHTKANDCDESKQPLLQTLGLVHMFSMMSTDYVGKTIYGGNPEAEPGSDSLKNYQTGAQESGRDGGAKLGLFMSLVSGMIPLAYSTIFTSVGPLEYITGDVSTPLWLGAACGCLSTICFLPVGYL
nr:hypothetical protein BaRGS_006969 [Batillaria attramentaria]